MSAFEMVDASIEANQAEHASEPVAHRDWLRKQLEAAWAAS